MTVDAQPVEAAPVVRPWWRRARPWLLAVAVLVAAAAVTAALSGTPGRNLDPRSAGSGGRRARAHVVEGYGTRVVRTTSLDAARDSSATVLLTSPDDYSDAQLR